MPPPDEPPADHPALFAEERSRLLDLLGALGPADWDRPTPCPGWDVLDLAAHLVGDDLSLLARHRDGHHGTPPPPGATSGPAFGAWLDQLQDGWVAAARRLSPRLVVDLLAWAAPQLAELQAAQDPRARTAHVGWAGPAPVPVWLDQARELSEQWIHRQQLLQALGRPADLDPALAGPVLGALAWAWPAGLAGVAADRGAVVAVDVTGPVAVAWQVVATAQGWDLVAAATPPAGPVLARLACTTDQAWRLLTGNLGAEGRAALAAAATGDPGAVTAALGARAVLGQVP